MTRLKLLQKVVASDARVILVERSVHSDRLFAKNCRDSGLMTEIEWILYNEWHEWLSKELLASLGAFKTIYLRCQPEIALRRLKH